MENKHEKIIKDLDESHVSDSVRIELLQYENLRKHFHTLVKTVLGEDYRNEATDLYKTDAYTCRDLASRLKPKDGRSVSSILDELLDEDECEHIYSHEKQKSCGFFGSKRCPIHGSLECSNCDMYEVIKKRKYQYTFSSIKCDERICELMRKTGLLQTDLGQLVTFRFVSEEPPTSEYILKMCNAINNMYEENSVYFTKTKFVSVDCVEE